MAVGLKDLHNAMVADGLTKQSYEDFRKYLNAPGKQGYQNRLNTYKYLKNNGVDIGSYDDFKSTLGFHAVTKSATTKKAEAVARNKFGGGSKPNAEPQAKPKAQQKPQLHNNKPQMPNMMGGDNSAVQLVGQLHTQQPSAPQAKASVRPQQPQRQMPSAGNVENVRVPYRPTQSEYQNMMAKGRQQLRDAVEGNNNEGQRLVQNAGNKMKRDFEKKYAEGNEIPTYKDSKGKTHTLYGYKNTAQVEKDLDDFANEELKRSGVVDAVDAIQKQKEGEANQFMQDNSGMAMMGGQGATMFNLYQNSRIQSPDAIFKESLNNMNAYLKANEKRYADMAKMYGFKTTKDFVESVVAPKLYNSMSQRFDENMMKKYSPKSIGDYIASGLGDSVIGTIATAGGDRSERQWRQQALSATEEGMNPYGVKAGKVAKLARMGVAFAADAPVFALTGGIGGAAGSAVTRGVLGVGGRAAAQYGAETAARATGFIASNSGKLGKAAEMLGSITSGAVNLGTYNVISAEAQALANATDWKSLGQGTLEALSSGVEGATTGAMLGVSGKLMGDLTSKWGIKPRATGKQLAKGIAEGAAASASRFAVESGVFATTEQFNSWLHGREVSWSPENFVESAEQLMVMKLTGAKPFSKQMQRYADTKARMEEAMKGMNDTEKSVYLKQMRDNGIIMPGWNGSVADYVKGMGKFSVRQLGQTLNTEFQSLYTKQSPLKLTEDEKQILTENTNANNVREAILGMVSEKGMKESPMGERMEGEGNEDYDARVQQLTTLVDNYKEFMADKSIPWTLKEKIGFALGSPMSGKPRMFKADIAADNTVTTYAEDGQVIDRKRFKTKDEAKAFEEEMREQRDSEDLWKAVTLLGNKRPDEKDYANAANAHLTQIGYGKDASTDRQIEEALKNPDSPITAGLRQATDKYNPLNGFLAQWSVANGVPMHDILDIMYNGARSMAGEDIRRRLKDDMEDYMQSGNVYDPYDAMRIGASRADEHLDNPDQPNGDGIKAETQRWNDAQKEFDELLGRNDAVKGLYGDGSKDDNELLEALKAEDENVVSQDDVDAVVRYLNARTRYNSYMDAMQDKIEDAASRARNEAVFNGKDGNGNPFGLPIYDESGKPMDGVMNAALVYATDADGNQVLVRDGVVRDNGDGTYTLENVKDNAGNDTGIVIVKDMLGNVKYASAADLKIDRVSDTKDFHDSYVKALQELVSSYASRPEEKKPEVKPEGEGGDGHEESTPASPVDITDEEASQYKGRIAKSEAPYSSIVFDYAGGKQYRQDYVIDGNQDVSKVAVVDAEGNLGDTYYTYHGNFYNTLKELMDVIDRQGDQYPKIETEGKFDDGGKAEGSYVDTIGEDGSHNVMYQGAEAARRGMSHDEVEASGIKAEDVLGKESEWAYKDEYVRGVANFNKDGIKIIRAKVDKEGNVTIETNLGKEISGDLARRVFDAAFPEWVEKDVPDWTEDKPEEARKRGFWIVGKTKTEKGQRIDRQKETKGEYGNDVTISFGQDSNDKVKGKVKVIDAGEGQPSHMKGNRNTKFFIPEAQPKERTDDVSKLKETQLAQNINPDEITNHGGYINPYQTSAPTVNRRGEAIQGNNRLAVLKNMYENFPEQAKKYKQYLIDHAAEWGLDPEAIRKMDKPILVNELDVDDAEAIRLGQKEAKDNESGGTQRIDPKRVIETLKVGKGKSGKSLMESFLDMILRDESGDDKSVNELIRANGREVLKWMRDNGVINDTQLRTAIGKDGELTRDGLNDITDILETMVFDGAPQGFDKAFRDMPSAMQKMFLRAMPRDLRSEEGKRIKSHMQSAVMAFNELNKIEAFRKAKSYEQARKIAETMFLNQTNMFNGVEGDRFNALAIELACRMRASKTGISAAKELEAELNRFFDLVQGISTDIFEPVKGKQSFRDAVKEVFGIDIEGKETSKGDNKPEGSDVKEDTGTKGNDNDNEQGHGTPMAGNGEGGKARESDKPGTPGSGEQTAGGERPSVSGGGAEEVGGTLNITRPELGEKPLTEEEIDSANVSRTIKNYAKGFLAGTNRSELAKAFYNRVYRAVRGKEEKPTDKPTDKPEDKPSDKPNEPKTPTDGGKPADKPNDKPTHKPAGGKTEKPKEDTGADKPKEGDKGKPKGEGSGISRIKDILGQMGRLHGDKSKSDDQTDKYSMEGMGDEDIDLMAQLVDAGAQAAYEGMKNGSIKSSDDFVKQVVELIGDPLKQYYHYTEDDVKDVVKDMWNGEYQDESGKVQTIAKWAKELNVEDKINSNEESSSDIQGDTGVRTGSTASVAGDGTLGGESGERTDTGASGQDSEGSGGENVHGTNSGSQGQGGVRSVDEVSGTSGGLRGNLQPVPGEGGRGKSSTHDSEGTTGAVAGVHPTRPVRGTDSVGRDTRIDLTKEKTPYVSASDESGAHSIGSVMPSGAATAVKNAFDRLVARVKKQVKDFVRDELGYSSDEEMFSDYEHGKETGLSGEQVDGVALAIDAMQQGRSFIIGDMTGVGKGRQGAAIIRWGLQHKKRVIFITEKRGLYTDMYRDLSDIGMEGVNPFCINASDKTADILDKDGNIVIKHPTTQAQKALWQTDKTDLPRDKKGKPYNFIMMTYDDAVARSTKGGIDTSKQDWLKAYAKDAIIVMDESHNASGNSQRSDYLRDLVKEAGGVTFMSATYAKRPDNMLLYAIRSSMSKANISEEDMLNAIKDYGVPLQEILANALFNNGEMIRRERDFTDVKTHWMKPEEVYSKEEVEATRRTTDAITDLLNDIIDFQRQFVNPIVNHHEQELQASLSAIPPQLRPNEHFRNSPYSGQVSNVMNLIVYGLKADKAASMAIEQMKAGKKPVIAVENTLGSYVNDLDNGKVDDVSFSNVLKKGIDFALRYKKASGSKKDENTHKTNPDYREEVFNAEEELDEVGKAALESLRRKVEKFASDKSNVEMTISPIDYIRRKIEEAGYSVGEITGRTSRIVKNADGTYTKESFKTDKKDAARRFNGGSVTNPLSKEKQLDALIVNVAGATGISLHASKGFGNRDPRTMIILQPARNVNTEVQMRGRIDRTGQESRGEYFYLTSPIPVEQKVTMMLRKKLSSLDANTVGNKDVKSNTVDATDMDNKYGDQVALEFLSEHTQDINAFLDKGKAIEPDNTGGWKGHDGLLYDLLIAIQRMPCSDQEYIINELTSRYVDQINYLNENGINDLETSAMNLDATTIDTAVFVPGSDNNSDNIFAKDTNIERVEVNMLKKPVKSDEIRRRMIKLGIITHEDGEDYYHSDWGQKIYDQVVDNANKQREKKRAKQVEKLAAELARVRKLVKKKDGESGEEYEERINKWPSVEELRMKQEVEYKAFDADLVKQQSAIYKAAKMYLQPGRGYLIPLSDDVTNNPQSMYGRFIGIDYKGGNPRTAKAIFATKDSRSIVTIPIVTKSRLIDYIHSIANDITFQDIDRDHDGDALGRIKAYDEWWDKMIPKNTSRTIRYMITGNVLQAAGKLGKYKGQIVTFTRKNKETGEVTIDRGMLLSEDFDPEDFAIKSPITYDDVMGSNETIHDNDANISVSHQGEAMLVQVFKNKGQSLKHHPIFNDKEFKKLTVQGDYGMNRDSILAWIPKKNVQKALDILRDRYHLSKTTMFVMPDSTERVDKIVPSGKSAEDVINEFRYKYNVFGAMQAQWKIDDLKKRYKMDVNNEELKKQIKELVQLRQAYLRKDNAREPDDRLGWELLIQEGKAAHSTDKATRERAFNTAEAIKEEFAARGLKGTEMHLKNGRTDLKFVGDLFTKLNKNKENQKIFEKVMEKMNTIGDKMKIVFDEAMENSTGGEAGGRLLHYNSKYFNSKWVTDQGKADTLLHEMVHTLTVYAKRCVDKGWEYLLDDDMVAAVHELDDIFNTIKNNKAFEHPTFKQYGTESWEEMLAEFGSNESFRNDTKKVSLWARLRDGFLRFFGFKKDGAREVKAYDAIGDRLMDLITSFNEHAWEEAYKDTWLGVDSKENNPNSSDVQFRRKETFADGQKLKVSYHLTSIYPSKGRWHVDGLNSEYSTPDAMLDAFRNKYPDYFATLSPDNRSVIVEPWSKYIGNNNASQDKKARDTRRATQAIEHMCGALNIDNVDVKFSNEGLSQEEQGAKGWYNKKTGQITINLANHTDIEDVKRTILHEGVAHYGLRKMFGEHFDTFLDNVYESAASYIQEEIDKMKDANGYDQRTATEEYLASLAEDTNFEKAIERGWWMRIKHTFVNMLAKAGFRMKWDESLNDADLRYILWRSYENLKEPGLRNDIGRESRDAEMRRKLGDTYTDRTEQSYTAAEGDILYRKVTDKKEIERLDKEPTIKLYRAMQVIDGKLYPPMSAKVNGKLREPIELGQWERSDEAPELADNKGRFKLFKGNGKMVPAAYNPYFHSSSSPFNDQFSEAQSRPNLVTVEVEVPKSELTSGYQAENAKFPVGWRDWKAGAVTRKIKGGRKVMLSRWDKPIRIVPDNEVANIVSKTLKENDIDTIPSNVVTPSLRQELEKRGVKVYDTDNRGRRILASDKISKDGKPIAVETTQKVADKLGASYHTKVNVATKLSDISDPYYRRQVERGDKNFKGWYDEKDGSVHIFAPNITSKHDAERVVWHETVGHKGMRQLLGDDGYRKYMKALWTDAEQRTDGLHAFVEKNLWSRGHGNLYDTIDEYLADAAEKGNAATDLWMAVRDKIGDVLGKMGFDTTPSIKDVKYMVWLSKHQLKKGQPLDEMKRQWILNKIDHQTDKNPDYMGRQFTDEGWPKGMESARAIRESQETTYHPSDTPSENFAREEYERRLKRAGYVWDEAYIDYMQAAQELIESITGKKIKDLDPNENFVMAENHLDSTNAQVDYDLYQSYFKPLTESVSKVLCNFSGKLDERIRQLQLYMVQKHGLERNRVFFVRDFLDEMEGRINASDPDAPTQDDIDTLRGDFNGLRAQLKSKLDKGDINLRDYFVELDSWITTNLTSDYKASERDYSGLSEMTNGRMADGRVKNGYDEDQILANVMDTEDMLGKDIVNDLWGKVKACTDYGLDYEYQSGLDSREQVERVKGMFDWYVPLRGFDDATAEETYGYVGNEGGAWVGPALMAAKGRRSTADIDIFATIGAMCTSAIQRGSRNKMKQVFARFIRNHYDAAKSLVVETKVWTKKDTDLQGNTIWTERFPDLKEGMSADEIAKAVSDFNNDMEALKAKGEAKEVRNKGARNLIFTKRESKNQHIVDVWINGNCHRFVVCAHPRAAQAINGLTRPVSSNGKVAKVVRIMSQLNTTYSPDFIVRNTLRDAIFAATNIGIKENPVYFSKYEKNYARVMGRMLGGLSISKINHNSINLFERYRKGKLNMSNELDRYFKEFMENGGQTGWVENKNVDKWKKIIEKGIKDQRGGAAKIDKNAAMFIPDLIETMNERAENLARFATYVTSRQSGRTVRRSIADAKEVSVNFNRKGSGKKALDMFPSGKATRSGWWAANSAQFFRGNLMFFNAGMQGLNNLAKNVSQHPIKANVAIAAFIAGGMIAPMLNAFLQSVLDGDDDTYKDSYAELPEWVRRNNICIYAGKGRFVTIPNAIETRAFYGIGDLMASKLTHKELDNGKNVVMDMAGQLSQISPIDPFGESSGYWVNTFVPSYIRPVVENIENTNWVGIPLERERASYNANDPRWMLAYSNTSELLKGLNKKVNAATNDVEGVPEEEDALVQGNRVADYATDPALLQHIVEGYLGGMGTTLTRMSNIARDVADGKSAGEIIGSSNMPIARTVHFEPTEQNSSMRTRTKYFDYVKKYTNLRADAMKLVKRGVDPLQHLKSFGQNAELTRAQMGKVLQTNKIIKKLNKRLNTAKNDEEKSRINQVKNRLMKETVAFVDSVEAHKK